VLLHHHYIYFTDDLSIHFGVKWTITVYAGKDNHCNFIFEEKTQTLKIGNKVYEVAAAVLCVGC